MGNTTLVDYGIQNEDSDIRAHVCVQAGRVYAYRTDKAVEVLAAQSYRNVPALTGDIITARGYLVPPDDIPSLYVVVIPPAWLVHPQLQIEQGDSPSIKGARAALIVEGLLKTLRFPLYPAHIEQVTDASLQVTGLDIDVRIRIQVKCDFAGGHKKYGGTGNLFLQVQECNPHGLT